MNDMKRRDFRLTLVTGARLLKQTAMTRIESMIFDIEGLLRVSDNLGDDAGLLYQCMFKCDEASEYVRTATFGNDLIDYQKGQYLIDMFDSMVYAISDKLYDMDDSGIVFDLIHYGLDYVERMSNFYD